MLSLTRLFLHNWHRFNHHLISVDDSLYLAGHNGSGKSSVLDAIQVVLVANQKRIHFNSSAQDSSERNLDTYVRGKIGEDRWLRPGRAVAYVALEFADQLRQQVVTVGVCIEAEPGRTSERTFFILPAPLDVELFTPQKNPLNRRDLRRALRERFPSKTTSYDHVEEYQTDLRDRLGGLNERFFDLFLRALHFKPIPNINGFVEQWLLEKKDLKLDTLRLVRERLQDLRVEAERVERRLARLDKILQQQNEVRRLLQRRDEWTLLIALLRAEAVRQQATELDQQLSRKRAERENANAALAQVEAALAGAEAALDEAKGRFSASEVKRRRDELLKHIAQVTRLADELRNRWRNLRQDLLREAEVLQPVAASEELTAEENAVLRELLIAIASLTDEPALALSSLLEAAIPQLDAAFNRATEARVRLNDHIRHERDHAARLEQEIKDLQAQGAIRYRPEVERLQELIRPIVGGKPKLLCELIEVSDPRWQDAVEAMLGPRRFNLIVAPEHFDAAARELERARAHEKLYDVGLIDLARAEQEARHPQPGALAHFVIPATPAVGAYIALVLGEIIACESVEQLRQHRRAVTPEVVVYGEYTVRAVNPKNYHPNYIGQQARRSQIEVRQRELQTVQEQQAGLEPQLRDLIALARLLDRKAEFARLHERLNQPLDEQPLRAQIMEAQAELDSLDLSGIAELEREVNRLSEVVEKERGERDQLHKSLGGLKVHLENLEAQQLSLERQCLEQEQEAAAAREHLPEAIAAAEELLAERRTRADLNDEVRRAESKTKEFETRANKETQALIELSAAYNTDEQFAARAQDPLEPRYAQERERLAATELPGYKDKIAQAEREAEDELREHVLYTLREQIGEARRKLEQINDALAQLPAFGNEKYRFTYTRADNNPEFYDLIMVDSQLLGSGSLFESQFYAEHKPAFDRFYDELTRKSLTEADQREQDRLTDYRHYLAYDIEVTHTLTGQKSRLSRILNQTSGGETQTPFYLTIAASFVQLYRIQEHSQRPTLRLVAFDEAFSKMDQDRIGATLDLFQHFKLQIITATPLERCEYLVPKICTSLVLTAVKDTVHIEPYRNYAARLRRDA
jgi:uncharacterized protein YPO0396